MKASGIPLLLGLGVSVFNYMTMANETNGWEPVSNMMLTKWGEEVSPGNVWREYPRPQLVRRAQAPRPDGSVAAGAAGRPGGPPPGAVPSSG